MFVSRLLVISFVFSLLLISCNSDVSKTQRTGPSGGSLKINENSGYGSLHPHTVKDLVAARIVSQIHLGLLKYDKKKYSVVSGIANDWDLDNSGTVYTFHLNPKAKFHDDNCFLKGIGRNVVAQDFKYTFELLAKNKDDNSNFATIERIKGAKEYRNDSTGTVKGIEGIEVLNDTTLQISLEKPFDLFEYQIASPSAVVLPREGVQKYGEKILVGAGAFVLKERPFKGENIILTRNNNFFMKDLKSNPLPFLDSVVVSFISSPKKELRLLEEKKIDLVMNIRSDYTVDFLSKYVSEFEKNPPIYVLKRSEKVSNSSDYNIVRAEVQNFYVNKMDNFDLSVVYKQKPKPYIVDTIEKK